ncbi:Sulfotransferase family protein [Ectothiorhodospira mobilis]|uniref:Sulfotransferase family protein n=1 Tax=Ectothiorhodospira mobilis TaxID=195064 RepID=A0A1I4RWR1_ECTMO|nr:sulfotransferase [Ectothiorhodospira mobilis]SFM56668.1 Sulfotransferase family protein [Ectothiorhodospira mobilis]
MRVIIGYSMRSGSTLLSHILGGHSQIRAYSDISSSWALLRNMLGLRHRGTVCIKPLDLIYLQHRLRPWQGFDRRIWLARDPRDSYLSTVESGYAYLFWRPGRREADIDLGLLARWRRIYRTYLDHPESWYRVHYEDLVQDPDATLSGLLEFLGLPFEKLYPFEPFDLIHGGDYKITQSNTVRRDSRHRYLQQLTPEQMAIFDRELGAEMQALGYPLGRDLPVPAVKRETARIATPHQPPVREPSPARHPAGLASSHGAGE